MTGGWREGSDTRSSQVRAGTQGSHHELHTYSNLSFDSCPVPWGHRPACGGDVQVDAGTVSIRRPGAGKSDQSRECIPVSPSLPLAAAHASLSVLPWHSQAPPGCGPGGRVSWLLASRPVCWGLPPSCCPARASGSADTEGQAGAADTAKSDLSQLPSRARSTGEGQGRPGEQGLGTVAPHRVPNTDPPSQCSL